MTRRDPVRRRDLLMAPYRHPLRRCTIETWRAQRELRRITYAAAGSFTVGALGVAAGVELLGLLAGFGAVMLGFVAVAWLVVILREVGRLSRSWARRSELRDVLRRRPQAGAEDPELVHDLFAVTVEDDGRLLTWRLRPLAIDEQPGVEEVEVPGRPRHAAQAIEDRAFAVEDAARAAEQLVEAQDRAARREAAAAAAAHRALEAASLSEEQAIEARSTAAALQRTTGQRSRRD